MQEYYCITCSTTPQMALKHNSSSENLKSYCVDLTDTIHLDSSALGMLLVLRDHAGGDQSSITIDNCSPEVKKIFAISSFEQLFNIK